MLKSLPEDINIEELLAYLPEGSYQVLMNGVHKRNSYGDIVYYEEKADGKTEFLIGRHSIYNSLPEYMFHSINRFDNIPERERKERFAEEYAKQESEKEKAHEFFSPIDALLLDLRIKVRKKISQYTSENLIMQEIIGDALTEDEKTNRFIKQVIPFLPQCNIIRGNRTLITMLLRKVLYEEGLTIKEKTISYELRDNLPQYDCILEDCRLDTLYVGNEYSENITTYTIQYWSDDECTEQFEKFLKELNCFRNFIQDYFLSIEDELNFQVVTDNPPLRLCDDMVYNYLNFNTNL